MHVGIKRLWCNDLRSLGQRPRADSAACSWVPVIGLYCSPMVLKLCVATPWCVALIFKGRREIIWITR